MSRHGYVDDCWDDPEDLIRMKNYRGAVLSALRGEKGQNFLQEILEGMAALPTRELIGGELVGTTLLSCSHWGLYETVAACALGSVALKRGMDVSNLDPEDYKGVAKAFGISEAMAREIMWVNDNDLYWITELPDRARFSQMRSWIEGELYERNR